MVCLYHIFLIRSSPGGDLGCFHVLTIVNSAAVNIGLHISFQISVWGFFQILYLRVKLLGHIAVLFLVFWKPPYCFAQWLHQWTLALIIFSFRMERKLVLRYQLVLLIVWVPVILSVLGVPSVGLPAYFQHHH